MLLSCFAHSRRLLFSAAAIFATVAAGSALAQQSPPPTFSQIVVFGDSLSDTGNVRDRTNAKSSGTVDYPSHTFNYSDGRFTNSSATDPASTMFVGVWHEQLARTFLNLQEAHFSLNGMGGTDYAFGGATTEDGQRDIVAVSTSLFGDVTITIDNMGRQMDNYFAAHPAADPNALYIVWGGGNDLFNDDSASSVTATAARVPLLVNRLVNHGAKYILVPNVPPLGAIPRYNKDAAKTLSLNKASFDYRRQLATNLSATRSNLTSQGVTLYSLDIWTNTIRLFSNPAKYGFVNTRDSAQGQSSVNPDQYLFWDDLHPTTAGHYQTAKGARDALLTPQLAVAKAANIATRVGVDSGERVSIAGIFVTGDVSKKVLIRGIGPTLAASGVPTPLADPTLTLFDSSGTALKSNDNWRESQEAEINATGIAPKNEAESAIVYSLPPGRYTAVLAGKNGGVGNGLVEVYDLEPASSSMLGNLSTRGFVGTGDNAMIGGLIIGSGDNPMVVFRAIGPSLSASNIANPLLDPTLELHDGNGALLRADDNWKDDPSQVQGIRAAQLAPTDDRESAIIAFLPPGNYTAIVRGTLDTTGVALVEAYRVE
ncbi:MAG: SGNH/GDSL hydrolase family protein [Verrucomicrobiota bacterium]|nr:SGNH/GDSL hydrolase family protein [Verrucomicrobiota bacterium]